MHIQRVHTYSNIPKIDGMPEELGLFTKEEVLLESCSLSHLNVGSLTSY